MLDVRHLAKGYGKGTTRVDVLRDVSFAMNAGRTLALEGESGSGKSTILHLIAGLDVPDSGSIRIDGRETAGLSDNHSALLRRTAVGVIFQQFNLIPSLTVEANIAFHARLGGRNDQKWTETLTARLGLADQVAKYPEVLSGGQQQRVAIARTLAARPKIILADEPTGNLDEATADTVLDLLLDSAREANSAVLMVTHSPRLAARMDHRLLLSHGTLHKQNLTAADELHIV